MALVVPIFLALTTPKVSWSKQQALAPTDEEAWYYTCAFYVSILDFSFTLSDIFCYNYSNNKKRKEQICQEFYSEIIWPLLRNVKKEGDFSIFCGLLRVSELYKCRLLKPNLRLSYLITAVNTIFYSSRK